MRKKSEFGIPFKRRKQYYDVHSVPPYVSCLYPLVCRSAVCSLQFCLPDEPAAHHGKARCPLLEPLTAAPVFVITSSKPWRRSERGEALSVCVAFPLLRVARKRCTVRRDAEFRIVSFHGKKGGAGGAPHRHRPIIASLRIRQVGS